MSTREWYLAHKEEVKARSNRRYHANKEQEQARRKQYRDTHPEHMKAQKARYYARHAEQIKVKVKAYHDTHKEEVALCNRRRQLYKRYGITLEQYDALMVVQNGFCAAGCGRRGRLAVDHDHTTGKVRGLLCLRCNSLMEVFDKPELESRLRAYKQRVS